MLTDDERRAMREHAAAVELHLALIEAARLRIFAATKARHAELQELGCSPLSKDDQDRRIRRSRGNTSAEIAEVVRLRHDAEQAFEQFNRENPPTVKPLDTPARLASWIRESPQTIDTYREARRRALAFAAVVRSVGHPFPEARDHVIGLQDILVWCDDAQRPAPPTLASFIGTLESVMEAAKDTAYKLAETNLPDQPSRSLDSCASDLYRTADSLGVEHQSLPPHPMNRERFLTALDELKAAAMSKADKSPGAQQARPTSAKTFPSDKLAFDQYRAAKERKPDGKQSAVYAESRKMAAIAGVELPDEQTWLRQARRYAKETDQGL